MLMTEEERISYLLERRMQIDRDMRDAEILFGLLRKTLSYVDEELKQFRDELKITMPLERARPEGVHINAKRTTAEERAHVVELYSRGTSFTDISNIVHLSKTTILRILRKVGAIETFRNSRRNIQ